ncbi:MAG: SMP-30/gluconolactonase/LRE family protein [Thermoplasmata archaeon]
MPDAVIDLQTEDGVRLVQGEWRYSDTKVRQVDFVSVGSDLGPSGEPNRTYDIVPHAGSPTFDDSGWKVLAPAETKLRLSTGLVCFSWYRTSVTIPEKVGNFDPTGSTVVFEVVADDYGEVWVNGKLPVALGTTGGRVVHGFNAPNRVVLGRDVAPGQRFHLAVFAFNGPISASPKNYIWLRTASLDFYAADRARPAWNVPFDLVQVDPSFDEVIPPDAKLEKVAGGFVSTQGPVWAHDGFLLFSSPHTNVIYRWTPEGRVDIFRPKSGYTGFDTGSHAQPGSNGLTFDREGRLTICQHGNRRVIRVEPHGNITVLADSYEGKELNSPHDLAYRSDGSLYFTDPPFGLPETFADPRRELSFSGVFRVADDEVALLTDELTGPSGLTFSPDEKRLYVCDGDPTHRAVIRYPVKPDGTLGQGEEFLVIEEQAGEGALGGMKVDQEGNLYVCGPGGVWVLSPKGRHLGTIKGPETPLNLAWGDEDGRAIYVTAMTSIYRLRLTAPGIRP